MNKDTLRQQELLLLTAITKIEVAQLSYLPLLNCSDWSGPVQSLYATAIEVLRSNTEMARLKLSDALAATRRALALTSDGL